MRLIQTGSIVLLMALAGTAVATDFQAIEKVKTGILPSGGFYSLHRVSCADAPDGAVVSMNRGSRWCAARDGALECGRNAREASALACERLDIAAVQEVDDSVQPN